MIAEIKSNFVGVINEVEFLNKTEYMISLETLSILEDRHKVCVSDQNTVVDIKEYIDESMSNEVLFSTIRGCLRTFAKSSESLKDFNLRLGSVSEYAQLFK